MKCGKCSKEIKRVKDAEGFNSTVRLTYMLPRKLKSVNTFFCDIICLIHFTIAVYFDEIARGR